MGARATQCPTCRQLMKFVAVEIQDDDHDIQFYECLCGITETRVVAVASETKEAAN